MMVAQIRPNKAETAVHIARVMWLIVRLGMMMAT